MSEEDLELRFKTFSKTGWNSNGSRMLATASLVSDKSNKKVKKKFADIDIFLVFVIVSLGIKFLTTVPLLIICSLSASYIVKKIIGKLYLKDMIEDLSGDTQKILVLRLMDLCELNCIDPESIPDLANHLQDESFFEKVLVTVITFVNDDTKYYVI